MTGMEHAIEQAAGVMDKNFNPDRYPIMAAMFRDYARALAEAGLLHDALPTPADGCQCSGHSQDAGGGYVEFLMEYEPSCPEHSEHVWNPRTGMWEHAVDRAEGDGSAEP